MIFKKNPKEKGQTILLITFLILIAILLIGAGLSLITVRELKMAKNIEQSAKAFFAADSGIEYALYLIKTDSPINNFLCSTVPEDWQVLGNQSKYCLEIINSSIPNSPNRVTVVGKFDSGNQAVKRALQIPLVDVLAFTIHPVGFKIIDVTDPDNAFIRGSIDADASWQGGYDLDVVGNYAYILDKEDNFTIIDVSNPDNPVIKIFLELTPVGTSNETRDIKVVRDYVYILREHSISLYEIDYDADSGEPNGISHVVTNSAWSRLHGLNTGHSIDVVGRYAYVSARERGINVYDTLSNLDYIGSSAVFGDTCFDTSVGNITVRRGFAYVPADPCGLVVIDIHNPSNPEKRSNNDSELNGSYILDSDENFVYVIRPDEFIIADVSVDPPTVRDSEAIGTMIFPESRFAVLDSYAYIYEPGDPIGRGIIIYDVSGGDIIEKGSFYLIGVKDIVVKKFFP